MPSKQFRFYPNWPHILFTVFLLSLSGPSGFAQNWFPIGATWHYTETQAFSGDSLYLKIWVEKDTLINGIPCQKFSRNRELFCDGHNSTEYAFERNDSVFLYMPEFNSFQLFYDLNMSAGDTLYFPILDNSSPSDLDTIRLIVDSVSAITIKGQTLKVQYFNYQLLGEFWTHKVRDSVIEKIGFNNYLFYYFREWEGACDGNTSRGLRCYEDSILGLFETGIANSCEHTYYFDLKDLEYGPESLPYPNPIVAGSFLNLPILNTEMELELCLYSPTGQLIFKRVEYGSDGIEIPSHLPKGQYRIVIRHEGELLQSSALLIQNP